MKKIIIGALSIFAFTSSVYADRERVFGCPGNVNPSEKYSTGTLSWENHTWTILLDGFSGAEILQAFPSPASLYCEYGQTTVFVSIPNEYKGRSCSFAIDKEEGKCESADVKDCVVYCEKR